MWESLLGFDFGRYTFRAMTVERPSRAVRDRLRAHGYLWIGEHGCFGDQLWIHSSFADKAVSALGGHARAPFDASLDCGAECWWDNCMRKTTWSGRNRLRLPSEILTSKSRG